MRTIEEKVENIKTRLQARVNKWDKLCDTVKTDDENRRIRAAIHYGYYMSLKLIEQTLAEE